MKARAAVGAVWTAVAISIGCGPAGLTPEEAERVRRGREMYAFEGCASCHGAERRGTKTAPALTSLARHWSADDLARYLRRPDAYPKSARLLRIADRFPAEMAGMPAVAEARLRDLVAFLLSR